MVTKQEGAAWAAVAAWCSLIFLGVPWARSIEGAVRSMFGRSVFSVIAFLFAALVIAAACSGIMRRGCKMIALRLFGLALLAAAYGWWIYNLRDNPEEAVHLIQYGGLALLSLYALNGHTRNWSVYLSAALLTSIVGTVDEILQWLHPARFFDFRDIMLNATAGALMLVTVWTGLASVRLEGPFCRHSLGRIGILACLQTILLALCLLLTASRAGAEQETQVLKLVFFTDVHAQSLPTVPVSLARAAEAIRAHRPDLILGGGDFVDETRETEPGAAWKIYGTFMRSLTGRLLHAPGNRDVLSPRDDANAGETFLLKTGAKTLYSQFSYRGYLFILLNSIQLGRIGGSYVGGVDERQLRWLRQTLSGVSPSTPIVLVTHIPLLTLYYQATRGATAGAPEDKVVINSKDVLSAFSSHNLSLVLQGHLHIYEELKWGKTTFVTGGALSGGGWVEAQDSADPGFVVAALAGSAVTSKYVRY